MSNPAHIDADLAHLWPPFRAKVEALLATMQERTATRWVVVEGHRSDERQAWLYAQGRTRPGKVVTWIRSTPWHGAGLAADLAPATGYNCPGQWWDILFEEETKLGLIDPPRSKGDLGHVQFRCDDATRQKAKAWTMAGFPAHTDPPGPQEETAHLIVNGKPAPGPLVSDGHGHLVLEVGGERMHIRNICAGIGAGPPTWKPGPPQTVEIEVP